MNEKKNFKYSEVAVSLYFVSLFTEIYAQSNGYQMIAWITKPMLMIVLSIYFWMNSTENPGKVRTFLVCGLIFSLFGDVFLMFGKDELFIFGLGSFLFAHICYILSFYFTSKENPPSLNFKLLSAIPFLIFVAGFMWYLQSHILANPDTAPLLIPVIVYSTVIAMMGYFAVLRHHAVTNVSFLFLVFGSLLFIMSDSVIAFNKFVFHGNLPSSHALIMIPYGIAQYLIAVGTVSGFKDKASKL